MGIKDMNREQLVYMKQEFLLLLADQGQFAEVLGVDYDEPSWHDLAYADEIVPDEAVYREWEGVEFVKDDFVWNI